MSCPMCGSDTQSVTLQAVNGNKVYSKQCGTCAGFWFEHQSKDIIDENSVMNVDVPTPNYSLKHDDLVCPHDSTLLKPVDRGDLPAGIQYWRCHDCGGEFYPKGQLAMISKWQHAHMPDHISELKSARTQAPVALLLLIIGGFFMNASFRQTVSFQAATDQVLPTTGPSILTLLLLGVTYLAGTILAVLGRKIPIVLVGWSVIMICLIAFSVIIFGP